MKTCWSVPIAGDAERPSIRHMGITGITHKDDLLPAVVVSATKGIHGARWSSRQGRLKIKAIGRPRFDGWSHTWSAGYEVTCIPGRTPRVGTIGDHS